MDLGRIRDVSTTYAGLLAVHGARPVRQDTAAEALSPRAKLDHALWMCAETAARIDEHGLTDPGVDPAAEGKANRWLGFVQGVLWVAGLRSIDQMRADNRT